MTDQPSSPATLFQARLETTLSLSRETSEHLRLTLKAAGLQVLALHGKTDAALMRDTERNQQALRDCETRMAALEAHLAALDRKMADDEEGEA
ncbi:hypothetical protein [Paracoccus sp. (in: a-proteobacteria)]|uniref:hypothetical protein n=1 Tax=Paracoccus sp. TaxID=267 RepID=UPI003A84837B